MKVTLVQTKLHWEDREANLSAFDNIIEKLIGETDVIVLPEMFTSGFSMDPARIAEPHNGPVEEWMKRKAALSRAVITGSVAVHDNDEYYNRLYWVPPDGSIQTYDKRHLFRMAEEDQYYSAGSSELIVEYKGWKIKPLICYDLRFPVWSRNRFITTGVSGTEAAYDLLIYVANWPAKRRNAWRQLLPARAIENLAYVVGVNRVGVDGNGFDHAGDSLAIDFKGEILAAAPENEESVITIDLDKRALEEFRKAFPAGLDADRFEIR